METVDLYWIVQVAGGLIAAAILYLIASGNADFVAGSFASNGCGATHGRAPAGFAPIAIGLALTLIHLVSIPVTNTSVNPARSTAVSFFAQNGALGQLWLFWVAPLAGAIIGATIWKALGEGD